MAKVDITGLLTGLAGTDLEQEGIKRASAIQGKGLGSNLARSLALQAPQREQMMRQGAGGLFGVDTRTAGQQVQEQLGQLDVTTPAGQQQAVKLVAQIDPTRALALQTQFSEANRTASLEERAIAADELRAATSGRSSSPFQFGASKTYKDSKGNYYLGTQKRTVGTGEVETVLSPVAGAPAKPQGAVEEVGAYGQTSTEMIQGKIDVKGKSTEAELFEKRKDTAATDFSLSSKNVLDADRMLRALDNITTGGFVPETAKLVTDFLGKTPADVGEFEILAKEQMIAKLSAFGANPTEGEAKRAAELVPAIRKSEGLNRRLVQSFREEMKRRRDNSAYLLGPDASVKGYREFSLGQYEGVGEEGRVINFGDLK